MAVNTHTLAYTQTQAWAENTNTTGQTSRSVVGLTTVPEPCLKPFSPANALTASEGEMAG